MRGCRPLTATETKQLKKLFSGKVATRNFALFYLGANTGFRVSELLSLTLGDVMDEQGNFKPRLEISRRNMKGKQTSRSVKFNAAAKRSLKPWLDTLASKGLVQKTDYLFQSLAIGNRAISSVQAWRVLTTAYAAGGMVGKLGTHAMRKTFANNVYNYFLQRVAKGEAVDAFRSTSKALGHADIKSTDMYLSFLTEDVDTAVDAVEV